MQVQQLGVLIQACNFLIFLLKNQIVDLSDQNNSLKKLCLNHIMICTGWKENIS